MALTQIRGNTQIMPGTIDNDRIIDTTIQTVKLAEGAEFLKRDGSVALTGNLNAAGFKLTGLADGTQSGDAVTLAQLNAVSSGMDVKDSVRVATTSTDGNIDLIGGTFAGSIDGVTLADGDRVLIKDQTDATENGIYVYTATGATFARSTDADNTPENEVSGGMFTFAEEGSVNADSGWILTSPDGQAVLGTDSLNFTQFSGAGQVIAGNGLSKTGNQLDVNVGDGVEIVSDALTLTLADSTLSLDASGLKLASLTSGSILVGNASNVATGVAMSGDVTMDNTGTTTLSNAVVTDAHVAAGAAIQTSKLADGANFIQRDGSVAFTAAQSMGGFKLTNVGDGTVATDAATFGQLSTIETNIQQELDDTQTGAGLGTTGAYSANASSNYLTSTHFTNATLTASLYNADMLLDAQIKQVADDVAALGSGSITDLQAEVDAIEASLGAGMVTTDGGWIGWTTSNYMNAATSVETAMEALDAQIATNTSDISTIQTNYAAADTDIQNELDATQVGAGLTVDGNYTAPTGTNWLDATTSLYNAITTLDSSVKTALDAKLDDSQLIDDDTFASASATTVPSSESVKTYVDNQLATQAVGFVDEEVPTGTIDGTNTAFSVAGTPLADSVKLYLNGQRLQAGATHDFTVSGSNITMNFAPQTGDELMADYRI